MWLASLMLLASFDVAFVVSAVACVLSGAGVPSVAKGSFNG